MEVKIFHWHHGLITSKWSQPYYKNPHYTYHSHDHKYTYYICSIRGSHYYLFHKSILCGFYSRVGTIREWGWFNSVKNPLYINTCTKGLEFYDIKSELTCNDLVSEQNFQHLDQPSLSTERYLHSTSNLFPPFRLSGRTKGSWRRTLLDLAWILCSFSCLFLLVCNRLTRVCSRVHVLTQILAVASIQEWWLFHSAHLKVRWQFESGD